MAGGRWVTIVQLLEVHRPVVPLIKDEKHCKIKLETTTIKYTVTIITFEKGFICSIIFAFPPFLFWTSISFEVIYEIRFSLIETITARLSGL